MPLRWIADITIQEKLDVDVKTDIYRQLPIEERERLHHEYFSVLCGLDRLNTLILKHKRVLSFVKAPEDRDLSLELNISSCVADKTMIMKAINKAIEEESNNYDTVCEQCSL